MKCYEWASDLYFFLGNAYYVLPGIASLACLQFRIGRGDECDREVRITDKDGNIEQLKNYLFLYTTISREVKVVSR